MVINPEEKDLYEQLCQDQKKVEKYKAPGVYCIKINEKLVYVGQSSDMLYRLAQHIIEIQNGSNHKSNKYRVLYQAFIREDCQISFDVLYKTEDGENMRAEISDQEARLIQELKPQLNYQLPKIGEKGFTINRKAKTITLQEILNPEAVVFQF